MASRKTTYTIGFDVDANKAQQQLNNLTKTLQNLTKQNQINLGLDEDIRKATESAKILQSTLSKALDINTGKIDFSAFTSELKKANTSVSEIANNLLSAGSTGQAAFAQMSASLASSEVQINKVNNAITQFAQTLKNTVKWEISSNIVHGIESALNNAIGYAKELNGTLNDIRIVSGASAEEMTQFAIQANKAAQQLSTTTNEFAKASLIYYQQGDSAALAAEKAAITTKAANVAFSASAKEMSQLLTAVWNSYQMGEDQLEHAVDVMAKLGATTASSTEEIAKAMQKVAPTANAIGVSFEQMSSIIATAASVTRQSAETVGTSWNTIINRLGSLKLGETLDDGVTLTKYSNALKTVGVDVLDASGNLRDMGIVIDELGVKWNTLTQTQKAALAQTVGGARNYTQITAFFENFDKYQKNMISANNATGELNKQADVYAQSWEAATKRQKAALESLYDTIINDKAMITMTDGLTTIIGLVEGLVNGLGGIPGILSNIGLIASRVFKDQITKGLANFGKAITNLGPMIKEQGLGNILRGNTLSSGDLTQLQAIREQRAMAQQGAQIRARKNDDIGRRIYESQETMLRNKEGFIKNRNNYTQSQNDYIDTRMNRMSDLTMSVASNQSRYDALTRTKIENNNLQALRERSRFGALLTESGSQSGIGVGIEGVVGNFTGVDPEFIQTRINQARTIGTMLDGMTTDINTSLQGASRDSQNRIRGLMVAVKQHLNDIASFDPTTESLEEIEKVQNKLAERYEELVRAYSEAVDEAAQAASDEGISQEDIDAAKSQGATEGQVRGNIESDLANIEALDQQLDEENGIPKANKFEKIAQGIQKVGTMAMSAVAGISSMSGMMDTLGDSSATTQQKISAVMGAASTLANAFATGGPWAAIATGAAMAAVAVIKYIDMQEAKMAEYRRKQGEAAIAAVESAKEQREAAQEQYETYTDLQKAYEEGEISHQEYVEGLTSVAEALDIEGAKVLALTGNYNQLAQAIEDANKKRMEEAVSSSNALVQQTSAQAGNILESTLNANMDNKVHRVGSTLVIGDILSGAYDELGTNTWDRINSRDVNDTAAMDFKAKYGIGAGEQGWEAIAHILGGTQGGDTGSWFGASWLDRNDNNLTIGTTPEQILAMYENILQLQEKAQDTSTFEGKALAELLSTSEISQLVDAITAAAQPLMDAKAMQQSDIGTLYLQNSYSGKTKADYSNEARQAMIEDVMSQWDLSGSNEQQIEQARKLAEQLVANFWIGVDDGLAASLSQDQQASGAIEKLKKYVEKRYGEEAAAQITDEMFADMTSEEISAVNMYDLNYTNEDNQFSAEAFQNSLQANGQQNLAMQRYNQAQSTLDTYYAGDYDTEDLGTSLIEQLFGSDEELKTAALEQFSNASVYEKTNLINQYIEKLNGNMDTYFTEANTAIKTANENVTQRTNQLDKECKDFMSKILAANPNLDENMSFEGFEKLYKTYDAIKQASEAGANFTGNLEDLSEFITSFDISSTDIFSSASKDLEDLFENGLSDIPSMEDIAEHLEDMGLSESGAIDEYGWFDWNNIDWSKVDTNKLLSWIMAQDPTGETGILQQIMQNLQMNTDGNIFSDENIDQMHVLQESRGSMTPADQSELDANANAEQRAINLRTRLDNQLGVKTSDYDDLSAMTKAGFISGDAEALAWIDMTEIQRKEQALKAMKQTLVDLKATGSLNEVDESLYNSKIRLQEIEVLQSKIQDTSTLQGLSHDAQEQEQLYKQGQEYYTQLLALYDKDSVEYKQALANKEAATAAYYSQFESKAESAAAVMQTQWDKELSGASNAMSIISSNLESLDKLDFQNIDNLKRNLIDAGISASRVEEIINNINGATTSEDKIKAGMVAATEAALAKLSTLGEQKQEYTGVITKLDTSPVADTEIPIQATLGNADEVESWADQDGEITYEAKTDETYDETITVLSAIDGTITYKTAKGDTFTEDLSNLTVQDGKIIYTTEKGNTFTQDITDLKIQDGKISYTIDAVDENGQAITVSNEIQSWVKNPADENGNYSITIQTDAGSITTAITDAVTSEDGYSVEVTLGDNTKQNLPAELQKTIDQVNEDNPEGLDFNANVDLVATGDLQSQIDQMDLSATVNLKGNITDTALNDYFTSIINGIYANSDDILKATQLLSQPFEQMFETLKEEQDWQFLWAKGSNVSWDSASQYLMVNLVQSVTKMSKTELKGLGPDVLKQIIDSLSNAIAHGDAQTAYLAQQLFAGLYTGIAEEGDGIAWEAALREAGVSDDIIAAFKSELGIHSPSELTKVLAKYLFDGLVEGIEEGDESFSKITLTNTKEKIAESVTDAINATGLEKLISNAYKDALANATTANDLASLGLSESLATQIVDAGGLQNAAEINGTNAMAAAQEKNDRERAALTAQMTASTSWSKDYIAKQVDAYIPKLSQEELEQIRDDAIESFVNEVTSDIDASKFTKDYIKNKKWNQEDISDMQKHIYNGALEAAMKELNFDNIESLNDDQMDQLMEKVQEKLNTNLEDLEVKIEDVWNEIQTVWQNGLLDIYKNETELANKTFNLWKETFSAIADARNGLMNGQSILESMYSNPDEIARIIQNWLNQGYEMSEIYKMLQNPDAVINFNAWDAEAYDKSGNQRFLNKDSEGRYANTNLTEYVQNIDTYVRQTLGPHIDEVVNKSIDPEKLQKSTDVGDQALYQMLRESGIINENNELTIDAKSKEEVYQAVVNGIVDGYTQADVDALTAEAAATQQAGMAQMAFTARSEAETQISTWQTQQDLVQTAMQEMFANGNLDNMSEADQQKLSEIMGNTEISFETLQAKSEELGTSITTLCEEIGKAMSMILSGQANSWSIGEDGHVTVSKSESYADAVANGSLESYDENEVAQATAKIEQLASENATRQIEQKAQAEDMTSEEFAAKYQDVVEDIRNKALEDAQNSVKLSKNISLGSDSVDESMVGDTISEASTEAAEIATENMEKLAESVGATKEEFSAFMDQLAQNTMGLKNFGSANKTQQAELLKLAQRCYSVNNAWKSLSSSQKSAIEMIKAGDRANVQYAGNLQSVMSSVKTIFNNNENVTEAFVENHIEDIAAMADGDIDAAERVEEALLRLQATQDGWNYDLPINFDVNNDGLIDELDTAGELINNFGDQYADQEIGFSVTADTDPAVGELENLLYAGDITADGINEALAMVGWEPEITWEPMSSDMKAQQQIGATVYDFQGNPFTVTEEALADTNVQFYVPRIKAKKAAPAGAHSMPSTVQRTPRAERPRAERPSKAPRDDRREEEREDTDKASRKWERKELDEIERYHQINKTLEYQSMILERINKLKSAKYGNDYVQALRQENAELVKQAELQMQKAQEAQQHLEQDARRLNTLMQDTISWWDDDEQQEYSSTIAGLGLNGITIGYDSEGNIDYEDLKRQLIAQYNEMGEKFAKDPEVWGDIWEAYQGWFDDIDSYIADYEESLAYAQANTNEILDAINQLSANNAEIIKYKVQLEIEEINFDKSWESYVQAAFSNQIDHVADILRSQMRTVIGGQKFNIYSKKENNNESQGSVAAIGSYMEEFKKAQAAYAVYQQYKDKIDEYSEQGNNFTDIAKLLGVKKDSFINEADYMTIIKEVRTNILTELQNIEQVKQNLESSYTNLLSMVKAEYDKWNGILSNRVNLTKTMRDMAELAGKNWIKSQFKEFDDYEAKYNEWIDSMYKAQGDAIDTQIERSRALYEKHAEQVQKLQEKGFKNLSDLEKKQYAESIAAMNEAQNNMYEYTKQKLELLREEYEETVGRIVDKMQSVSLEGTGADDFDELKSDYEYWNEQQDRYLSSAKELYEVSKLNRSLNDSIANASSKASKERLEALQSEINLKAKSNKLTEYDVQQMNLQYQLALKLEELENARNNKSIVRLTRDEYGNMGYQYLADENDVSAAQQSYEDTLNQINELAENRVKELQSAYVDTMSDYYTKLRQITIEYGDDQEKMQEKIDELNARTKEKLEYLGIQLDIANTDLMNSNAQIFEHYRDSVEDYVGTPDASEGISPLVTQLRENWEEHKEELTETYVPQIIQAVQDYQSQVSAAMQTAQLSTESMTQALEDQEQQALDSEQALKDVTAALDSQYTALNEATSEWQAYEEQLLAVQAQAEETLAAIEAVTEAASEDTGTGTGASSGTGSGSGQQVVVAGGGGDDKIDTVTYKFKKGAKIYNDADKETDSGKQLDKETSYKVSKYISDYVYAEKAGGWIHIKDIDKEMSQASTYSTYALQLSEKVAHDKLERGYKTGGVIDYTGPAWVDGTPSAPEYVLNAQQTDKMFQAVETVSKLDVDLISDIFDTINLLASSFLSGLGGSISAGGLMAQSTADSHNIEQHIEINAEFPDASDYTEIKAAFDSLVNTASQYANKR